MVVCDGKEWSAFTFSSIVTLLSNAMKKTHFDSLTFFPIFVLLFFVHDVF